jgi:cell division protein FtsB
MSRSSEKEPSHGVDFIEWLNRILITCLALAVLGWMALKFLSPINKDRSMRLELDKKERLAAKLAAEHQQNRAHIDALRNNSHAAEKAIRERLGYGKTNELIVTFVDSPAATPTTNRPTSTP